MNHQYKQISGRVIPARATATITVSNYATIGGSATVTINGIALTNGVEWSNATGNDETATSIAAAITTATATTLCTAVAVAAVVTITAVSYGTGGNALTVATSDAAKLLKSAALLSGGTSVLLTSDTGKVIRLIDVHLFITTAAVGGGGLIQIKNGATVIWQCTANAIAQHDIDFHDGLGYPITAATDLTVIPSGGVTSDAVVLAIATGYLVG